MLDGILQINNMEKKGIGPQGLGVQGHNGFWIGSPLQQKCWDTHKIGSPKTKISDKTGKRVNNCVKK
jgi:hypothetical protein